MNQLLYTMLVFTTLAVPAYAGGPATPELDSGMLGSLAAAFTGCYAAFRVYKAKKK